MRRPGVVIVLAVLLIIEAIIFGSVGFFVYQAAELVWAWRVPVIGVEFLARHVVGAVSGGLAVVALLTSFFFFRMHSNAWVVAVFVQGVALLVSLILYVGNAMNYVSERSIYGYLIYFVMLCGVFMVIYLNHSEVRLVFRVDKELPRGRRYAR
ncbi:MAG: hypothetical protein ACP5GX_05905 [Anaerolineae bacterium]